MSVIKKKKKNLCGIDYINMADTSRKPYEKHDIENKIRNCYYKQRLWTTVKTISINTFMSLLYK